MREEAEIPQGGRGLRSALSWEGEGLGSPTVGLLWVEDDFLKLLLVSG